MTTIRQDEETGIWSAAAVVTVGPALEEQLGGILGLPMSFVVDRQGRVVQTHIGWVSPGLYEGRTSAGGAAARRRYAFLSGSAHRLVSYDSPLKSGPQVCSNPGSAVSPVASTSRFT